MQGGRAGGIRIHVSRREEFRDCVLRRGSGRGMAEWRQSRADPGQLRPLPPDEERALLGWDHLPDGHVPNLVL
jgi:hypothetical protein